MCLCGVVYVHVCSRMGASEYTLVCIVHGGSNLIADVFLQEPSSFLTEKVYQLNTKLAD